MEKSHLNFDDFASVKCSENCNDDGDCFEFKAGSPSRSRHQVEAKPNVHPGLTSDSKGSPGHSPFAYWDSDQGEARYQSICMRPLDRI